MLFLLFLAHVALVWEWQCDVWRLLLIAERVGSVYLRLRLPMDMVDGRN